MPVRVAANAAALIVLRDVNRRYQVDASERIVENMKLRGRAAQRTRTIGVTQSVRHNNYRLLIVGIPA